MSEIFVNLPIEAKRADILTRMDVLHDKLVQARQALTIRKQHRKTKNLNQEDNTINLQLNQTSLKPTFSSIATETKFDQSSYVPTSCSQNQKVLQTSEQLNTVTSSLFTGKNNQVNQRRYTMGQQPILQDKENGTSPLRNAVTFKSPQRKVSRNRSTTHHHQTQSRVSPVRLLRHQLNPNVDQNLLSEQDQPNATYPLQLVSQNSLSTIPRQSFSTTKKCSTGSILSGEKPQNITSHPRYKFSNKYLELSGCQWQSALLEEDDVNDFDQSAKSRRQFKEISFIPSIFQKKTIRPKKKKAHTKEYIEITGDVRDKVANMIKERLRHYQQVRDASKKEKNVKQSYNQFLQTADLQKKFKQTLTKKVLALNGFKAQK